MPVGVHGYRLDHSILERWRVTPERFELRWSGSSTRLSASLSATLYTTSQSTPVRRNTREVTTNRQRLTSYQREQPEHTAGREQAPEGEGLW
jgi:hypothetical protein